MSDPRETKQRIAQISRSRESYDTQLQELQLFIDQKCVTSNTNQNSASSNGNRINSIPIQHLRIQFITQIENLKSVVRQNIQNLNLLKYKCGKFNNGYENKNGQNQENNIQRIQSLHQYFQELNRKVTVEWRRGQEIIGARERWQIVGLGVNTRNQMDDDESSLLNSYSQARQSTETARNVLTSLNQQSNRLEQARKRMSSVLKNINFAGNILQMIRTRSRQDNKLIAILSFCLLIEIILCLFVIKPWLRG